MCPIGWETDKNKESAYIVFFINQFVYKEKGLFIAHAIPISKIPYVDVMATQPSALISMILQPIIPEYSDQDFFTFIVELEKPEKYSFYVVPNHYGFSTEINANQVYTTQEMFGYGKNGSDSYDLINANLWNQMLFDPKNLPDL